MVCAVCDKIKEKKALIVYEDDELIAVLPSKPAVIGHIKIMPKNHITKLEDMSSEQVQDLFFLSNFASSSVFEALQCHGTNIILNENDNHLCIDVIPRKENDGLNFLWKPKQLQPEEMENIFNKIKDKTFVVGKAVEEKKQEPVMADEKKEDEVIKIPEEEKTNYLIKHLQKIP